MRRDRRSFGWITNHNDVCVCMHMNKKKLQQRCQNQQRKCNKNDTFLSSGECAEFQRRRGYRRQT